MANKVELMGTLLSVYHVWMHVRASTHMCGIHVHANTQTHTRARTNGHSMPNHEDLGPAQHLVGSSSPPNSAPALFFYGGMDADGLKIRIGGRD